MALIEEISLSRKSIWRRFKPFFNYQPTSSDSLFLIDKMVNEKSSVPWVLGIDGKWLHRKGVVMIYRDVTKKINLFWSFHLSESYEAIEKDFERILPIVKNNPPVGVVTDWKGALVSAVNMFLPPIPHQRCLSHVKRSLMRFFAIKESILAKKEFKVNGQKIFKIKKLKEKILLEKRL